LMQHHNIRSVTLHVCLMQHDNIRSVTLHVCLMQHHNIRSVKLHATSRNTACNIIQMRALVLAISRAVSHGTAVTMAPHWHFLQHETCPSGSLGCYFEELLSCSPLSVSSNLPFDSHTKRANPKP